MRLAAGLVALVAVLIGAGFVYSLLQLPTLTHTGPPHAAMVGVTHRRGPVEAQLLRRIREDQRHFAPRPLVDAQQISGGYFAPWEEDGIYSFEAHARDLTHVYPTWLELGTDGRTVRTADFDPRLNRSTPILLRVARANGVHIVPVIGNATEGAFDAHRLALMLDSPANSRQVIDQLAAFVHDNDFAGIQIDFELLTPDLTRRLSPWLAELHRRLGADGKELSIALEVGLDDSEIRTLAANVDYGVAMVYDEHNEHGAPGSISSARFIADSLHRFSGLIPPGRLVLNVGLYGYDWTAGVTEAESITNAEAMTLAEGYRDGEPAASVVDFDPAALEPTFQYVDETGRHH